MGALPIYVITCSNNFSVGCMV